MKSSIAIFLCLIVFLSMANQAFADSNNDYLIYMNSWDENIKLASKKLKEAETFFKSGDELKGCITQREASKYGIKATQSLIEAFKISSSTDDLSNLMSGLAKWEELRDFC